MKKFNAITAVTKVRSAVHLDLLQPEQCIHLISIDDIAWALANINRYNGHSSRPYSVAEHCLLGLPFCSPWNRFDYLMHDSPEAYLGDITGPFKNTHIFGEYRELESRWWATIAERYGLRAKPPKEVDDVDRRMCATELRDLMGRPSRVGDNHQPFDMRIPATPRSPEWLAEQFVASFYSLSAKTEGAKR